MFNPEIFKKEISMISTLLIENNIKVYKMEYYGFKIEQGHVIISDNTDSICPAVNIFINKEDKAKYISIPLYYNMNMFRITMKKLQKSINKFKKEN